jgi:hypothetical protein
VASVLQFVDSISATPTVRLDLNSLGAAGLIVGVDGIDLSPPPLRRAVVNSFLVDGSLIPATAYDNRVIKLPLIFNNQVSTVDQVAAALQPLARELDRPNNFLRVQLTGQSAPVFFRTFSAPDYGWQMPRFLAQYGKAELSIPAEPFGYGLRQTLSPVTVNNDPAAVGNGCFWDVTGVQGDVETPAVLSFAGSLATVSGVSGQILSRQTMIGVRRRGTPSNAPFLLQAESMTQGSDTTVQANDVAMSGASNNYSRTTFAVFVAMVSRISKFNFPGSSSTDLRGTYRVIARYRKSVATDTITVQLRWGYPNGSGIVNDLATLPTDANATNIRYVDLGLVSFPLSPDPGYDGYSGVELPVNSNLFVSVEARRVAGTGTVDWDHLLFVPADDHLAVVAWPINFVTPDNVVIDGAANGGTVYGLISGAVAAMAPISMVGSFPMLSPSPATNRIVFVRDAGYTASATDGITGSTAITLSYWPRYLNVRPATT